MGQYIKVYVNGTAISEGDNSNPLSTKVNFQTKPESDVISAVIRIPEGYVTDTNGIGVLVPQEMNTAEGKVGDTVIQTAINQLIAGMKVIIANNEYTIASVDKTASTLTLTEGLKTVLPAFTTFHVKDYDCWAFSKDNTTWTSFGGNLNYEAGLSGDLNLYIKAKAKETETAEVRKDCKIAILASIKAT